jgi:soluble lytic murein transglycosylase-like protein
LIKAVIAVESNRNPNAISSKGAQGLMQIMPATASRFGMKDPFDTSQNIMTGSKYLKQLLALFNGDVELALAGYNAGENAIIRYGNRIPPFKETQAYVRSVLLKYKQLSNRTRSERYFKSTIAE